MTADDKKFDTVVGMLLFVAACVGILAIIGGMDVASYAYKHTFEKINHSN